MLLIYAKVKDRKILAILRLYLIINKNNKYFQ